MPEVSIYVALITGAVALIPQFLMWLQNQSQARAARRVQHLTAVRHACMALYDTAADLRTQVQNNHEYHGEEMAARLAQVRQRAADASKHAVSIALMVPPELAHSAWQLAEAAFRVAESAGAGTNLDMGRSVSAPDLADLDARTAAFRERAVSYTMG